MHLPRAGLISSTLCFLVFLPFGAEAFECASTVDESDGTQRVIVTTDPDAAPPRILIVYVRDGIVATYAIGGVFVSDEWKLLGDEAYDIDGKKFEKVVAQRESTTGGTAIEAVHIPVHWSYLESHVATGIDVTIYGEEGDADLFIEPQMISAFFSCLEPSM